MFSNKCYLAHAHVLASRQMETAIILSNDSRGVVKPTNATGDI